MTPLHLAAWAGDLEIVSDLLAAHADPYRLVGGVMDLNAFALAAMTGRRSVVCRMLEHKPMGESMAPAQLLSLEEILSEGFQYAHYLSFPPVIIITRQTTRGKIVSDDLD